MTFPSDLRIARTATLRPLPDVAGEMGIGPHLLESYGAAVAKIKLDAVAELADRPAAKYIVVTAEIGAQVAELAARLAREGNESLRGDARTAELLAQAGGQAATALAEINETAAAPLS